MAADAFDSLLGLEDTFYEEGYQLGVTDGSRAGRIEGRVFGLERGFEKYVAMGRLHGKSAVWAGRLSRAAINGLDKNQTNAEAGKLQDVGFQQLRPGQPKGDGGAEDVEVSPSPCNLPPLPQNTRLVSHIQTLYALVEPASLSTQNSEDSVSDFDDRLRRAAAKIKIIEKFVGEVNVDDVGTEAATPGAIDGRSNKLDRTARGDEEGNIEDITAPNARR